MASALPGLTTDDLQSLCECPVCLEYYKEPRLLKCGHQFCESCLEGIIKQSPTQDAKCPTCRVITKTNRGDVKSLPRSTLHQYIQDLILQLPQKGALGKTCTKCNKKPPTRHCPSCREDLSYMCDDCYKKHQLVPSFKLHQTVLFDPLLVCSKHSHKMVQCFCHHCLNMACDECIFETHGEHGDKIEDMKAVADNSRHVLRTYTEEQKKKLIDVSILKVIEDKKAALASSKKTYRERTKEAVAALEKLIAKLKSNEQSMISTTDEDMKTIAMFQAKVSDIHVDQEKMLQFAESLLKPDISDPQIIMGSRNLPEPNLKEDSITVRFPGNIETITEITKQVEKIISSQKYNSNSEQIQIIRGSKSGEESRSIKVMDKLPKSDEHIPKINPGTWELKLNKKVDDDGTVTGITFVPSRQEYVVRSRENNQTYLKIFNHSMGMINTHQIDTNQYKGEKYYDEPSDGGISIDTKRDLYLLPCDSGDFYTADIQGNIINQTNLGGRLYGVAYAPGADVYVMSGLEPTRVMLLSPSDLSVIRTITQNLSRPYNVCVGDVSGRETIFVSNWYNGTIITYSMDGGFISSYRPQIPGAGKMLHPRGLCFTSSGHLLVCNSDDEWNPVKSRYPSLLCINTSDKQPRCSRLLDEKEVGVTPRYVAVDENQRSVAVIVGQDTIKLYKY